MARVPLALRVLAVLVLGCVVLGADLLRPQSTFNITRKYFDSEKTAPVEIRTPSGVVSTFSLHFATRVRFLGGDILESDGSYGPSVRLEMGNGHTLDLFLFGLDTEPIPISDKFFANRWHRIDLTSTSGADLIASVDGVTRRISIKALHQAQSSAEIGSHDFGYRFDRVILGSGYSPDHDINGEIRNFRLRAKFYPSWPPALVAVVDIGVVLCVALLLWPSIGVGLNGIASSDILAVGFVAAGACLGYVCYLLRLPGAKWDIILFVAAAAVIVALLGGRARSRSFRGSVSWAWPLLIGAFVATTMIQLPNAIWLERMFARWQFSSAWVCTLVVFAVVLVLKQIATRTNAGENLLLRKLPYLIFVILALRADPLFAKINALHWAYFVGPVVDIRNGGWLLWDVPSQYGFLNVLLASLVPVHYAVDAVFLFQALALFAAASLFYRTLYRRLGLNPLLACAVVVPLFFFADPLLIGPAAYPSMSAVRFIWCYVLLAIAAYDFLGPKPSATSFAWHALPAWLAGMLWSAESAIYVTVIYSATLLADVVLEWHGPQDAALKLWRFFWPAAAAAASAITVILGFYWLRLGHLPDASMFAMYATSYGDGFGQLAVPILGPGWLVVLTVAAAAAAFVSLRAAKQVAAASLTVTAAATIWIATSYYFGRAYPVVITTLLPLIVFVVLILVRTASKVGPPVVQTALALPILAISLSSIVWNANIPLMASGFISPALSVAGRWPAATSELQADVAEAGIVPGSAVVFHGNWVAMPRFESGMMQRVWLPTPLQALEPPISPAVRDEIADRFIHRHRLSGYLIEDLTEMGYDLTTPSWVSFIGKSYDLSLAAKSKNYAIYRATLRTAPRQNAGIP